MKLIGEDKLAAPRKKPPVKKAVSGTMGERLGEARNRPYKGTKGGAVTKVTKPRATGRQYSGDTIKMKGPQQGITKPKVVPLGDRPKLLSGPKTGTAKAAIGVAARNAAVRAVGVGAIFDPSFMSYRTGGAAGEGSDRPSGPLFSPSKNRAAGRGNPKTVNPYRKSSSMAGGSKMAKSTQSGAMRPKISMAGGGVNKPETASTFKQKNLAANQKVGKDASSTQAAPKAAAPAPAAAPKQPKGMTFQQAVRRNRTEEYTRAKMKPKGSFLGLLRKRKSMG